ncbi:MAG: NAD-dependent epimerase/dehydratase family protein [Bacteroidetes bacterium]|nr:MAG: NAD-dependent epimerase/dehydratase family protein [Bacteroidota bacterium]REK08161.1 MAG: NAD-dependent epimerase/dehydratase family protein [Bacteroidota bacterium]REK32366.1 MAG: NAD-dependent epimerase/dehydratase family protein [Bacteroidota bacterium]REK49600.1 MAG: NAD-dependent epimerase/dehydratase family protein [Bacteroidota bacterium]
MKTALIAGSTGLVGKELLKLLLEDQNYSKVISLVRSSLAVQHPKLHEVIIDFNKLGEYGNYFDGVDHVFCCLGTTMKKAGTEDAFRVVDYDYPVKLAMLAEEHGCKGYYCISAMGADSKSKVFYNRVKGTLEKKVLGMKIPTVIFFRPSLLIGYREETRWLERLAIWLFRSIAFIFWGPLRNFKAIPASKVAKTMLRKADEGVQGHHIVMSGEML